MRLDHLRDIIEQVPWLDLPARDFAPYSQSSLQYGAGKVASQYCKLASIQTQIIGGWFHGWMPNFRFISEKAAPEPCLSDPTKEPSWVATKEHEAYARSFGYKAKAIGSPFAYLPDRDYIRRPGSLLVMPAHSLEYTRNVWRFEEFADAVDQVRSEFSFVAICIYPACIEKGYWVENFKRRGYPIIEGAHALDRNSIERVRALMSQFEFVTTNTFGSCIAYGCAFGAKVSLYGPYAEEQLEGTTADPYYLNRPGLAEKTIAALSESNVRKHLGEFFVKPSLATSRKDWGLTQIGKDNVVAPQTMKRLFGWNASHRLQVNFKNATRKAVSDNFRLVKSQVKAWIRPGVAKFEQEVRRLNKLTENQPGIADLYGRRLHFADVRSFLEEYDRVFSRLHYDFPCVLANPLIIDASAGCGVAVRFWSEKFPAPRILALEPDPARFAALQANTALVTNAELKVFSRRDFLGLLVSPLSPPVSPSAEAGFGTGFDGAIDFLNLPVLNEWSDSLLSHPGVFKRVCQLHFEYRLNREEKPALTELLAMLTAEGFTYTIENRANVHRPLYGRIEKKLKDGRLNVWAWKE